MIAFFIFVGSVKNSHYEKGFWQSWIFRKI